MQVSKNITEGAIHYNLSGRFLFSDHEEFRRIVEAIKTPGTKHIEIDLANLEFIDSAALGMFLVAREEAEKHKVDFTLKNPKGHVQKMFQLSNFSSLFKIV